jgi:transcriptional regulator with XRE-family HTH domain
MPAAAFGRVVTRRDRHALARQLRQARINADWKQQDVAIALGIPVPTLSQIEQGAREIDLLEVRAYLTTIGVPFVDFVAPVHLHLSTHGDD